MTKPISSFNKAKYNFIWLLEHFFRLPFLGALRKKLTTRIASNIPMIEEELFSPVPIMEVFDFNNFITNYVKKSQPVVIKGIANNWEAIKKWSPEFLASRYPDFPVILYDRKKDNPELKGNIKHTTIKEYVDSMNKGSKNYIRFLPLLDKQPELEKDFRISFIKRIMKSKAKGRKTQLFMGGKNTKTTLHGALGSNLFVQVYGRKKWWIYNNDYNPILEPIVERSVFFRSDYCCEQPQKNLKKAKGWTVTLEPGDILYNPPFYWHQIKNLDKNIAIGFRWYSLSSMLKSSLTQTLLSLTASNPSISKAKKMEGNYAEMHAKIFAKSKEE